MVKPARERSGVLNPTLLFLHLPPFSVPFTRRVTVRCSARVLSFTASLGMHSHPGLFLCVPRKGEAAASVIKSHTGTKAQVNVCGDEHCAWYRVKAVRCPAVVRYNNRFSTPNGIWHSLLGQCAWKGNRQFSTAGIIVEDQSGKSPERFVKPSERGQFVCYA